MSRDKQLRQFKQSPAPSDWADSLNDEHDESRNIARPFGTVLSREILRDGKVYDFSLKNKHRGSGAVLDSLNGEDRIVLEDPKAELIQSIKKSARKLRFKAKKALRNYFHSCRHGLSLLYRFFRKYPKYGVATCLIVLAPVALIILANTSRTSRNNPQTSGVLAETVEKGANRIVYYPSTLPSGYRIVSSDDKAITNELISSYTITNNRANIVVSQQDYMPEQAFNSLFNGADKIETSLGNAFLVLDGENSKLGGVRLSDGRTVLLNATYPLDKSTLSLILLTLQPKK